MADNPIKHSDIIQQGNPFKDTIKGLEKMIKLLREAAKDYLKFASKQNVATKEGRKNIQAVTKATKQLSIQEKEALKVKRALEREQAKANLLKKESHRALIREVEAQKLANRQTEKAIKAQARGAKSTNKWSKAVGSFAFKFNALGNIAANVASKITRSISRAVRGAADILIDFDQAMADVKAITGATGKDFDKLSKSAKSLGGVTKFTATQVAQLQKEYAKLGLSTEQILGAQAATLDLAAATNTELARAAEVVGITLKQFGLQAEEARRVTDVMAKSFATSALDMEKFGNAMKFVGPAARVSGLSIERTTAMLAQLADAGISGTMAGSALRNIMLGLAKESGTLTEKIAKVAERGLDLAGASEEVQRRAATALLVLAEGVDTIDEYTRALEDAAFATADMANVQLDTLRGQLTLVKSAWEGMILAMLDTEGNISTIKAGLVGIIDVLTAIGIRQESFIEGMTVSASGMRNMTKLTFAQALAIAKITRETAAWGIEVERGGRSIDEFVEGFGKIGGWIKDLGKDLWNELFPKQSSDVVKDSINTFIEEIKKLKETRDNASLSEIGAINKEIEALEKKIKVYKAAGTLIIEDAETFADEEIEIEEFKHNEINKKNKENRAFQKQQRKRFAAEDAAAKKEQAAKDKEAEDLKQRQIQATFDLANRLTSTFTSFFESQKNKELAAFESKQVRELALVEGNAAATKATTERLAEERGEIESKFRKKQQILAIGQAIVDGALAIQKIQGQLGFLSVPFMIASAALTAVQIGIIASQKFGEGEVDIGGPSHSMGGISAEIEGGESVINKRSTAKHKTLLEAINANDSSAIADAALHNQAFHEVWGRTKVNNVDAINNFDPNIKKMREIMEKTPVYLQDGPRTEYYPALDLTRIYK